VTSPSAAQDGNTALIKAAFEGHLEVVKQLLEAGADKDVQNKVRPWGLRARRRARRRGAWGAAGMRGGGGGGGGGTGAGVRGGSRGGVRFSGCGNAGTPRGAAEGGNCGATDALVGAAGRGALARLVPAPLTTRCPDLWRHAAAAFGRARGGAPVAKDRGVA